MNALQERLGAAVEMDALDYDGAVFARDRYGAVRGRIARRRAARSAGIGGASVLGVGAVAFGAGQVPWSGFVLGATPAGSGSVVCTTSGPDAVAGSDEDAPDFAVAWATVGGASLWTFAGKDGDTLATAHLEGDVLRVTDFDGTSSDVEAGADGAYTFTVGGYQVSSTFADGQDTEVTITKLSGDSRPEAPDIEVLAGAPDMVTLPNNFMGSVDAEWTVTQDGQAVAQAHLDGATLVLDVADGTRQHVEPESDGTYLVTLAGQTYRWSFDGGGEVIVTMQQGDNPDSAVAVVTQGSAAPVITPLNDASPSPSVTCVTTTPEPSASATPSAVPTPAATSNPVSDGSPFQCGFPINGDFIADGLTIGEPVWKPSTDVNAQLADKYGDMNPLPQAAGSDDVVTMTVSSSHLEELGDSSSGWSQRDPVTSAELDAPQADLPLEEFGLTFAAVVDGKIVGTVGEGPWTANPFVWTDSDAAYSMDLTYLNPENAMTYCDGYGPNDDADLYLIAGTVTINAGGSTTTPIYSWKQVTPAP